MSLWVRFTLRTYVKRVGQRSSENRGFFPGALKLTGLGRTQLKK